MVGAVGQFVFRRFRFSLRMKRQRTAEEMEVGQWSEEWGEEEGDGGEERGRGGGGGGRGRRRRGEGEREEEEGRRRRIGVS